MRLKVRICCVNLVREKNYKIKFLAGVADLSDVSTHEKLEPRKHLS